MSRSVGCPAPACSTLASPASCSSATAAVFLMAAHERVSSESRFFPSGAPLKARNAWNGWRLMQKTETIPADEWKVPDGLKVGGKPKKTSR